MVDHTRDLDLLLYGATGFTGRQAARYVAGRAPRGLRWGIGGRNREKLEALRGELPEGVELVVADSGDAAAVGEMARRTRVVASTAGPFARHGSPVVEACVEHGSDYCDITGETPWVRRMIDSHHERAAARGTRVVPCCGFDSVPSDLGAWWMGEAVRERFGQATRSVRAAFQLGGGGLNGGTLASLLALAEDGELEQLADPVLLNPPERRGAAERERAGPDRRGVEWDPALERWLAPFFMAPINTRVVRRSVALRAEWGELPDAGFAYDEALELRQRVSAWGASAGSALFMSMARRPVARRLLKRFGPKPGEGPSERARERGWFRCRYVAEAADGRALRGELAFDGDPGNRATVAFLCESALALCLDRAALPGGPTRGGVLTPATALGGVLVERLRRAGARFELEDTRTS